MTPDGATGWSPGGPAHDPDHDVGPDTTPTVVAIHVAPGRRLPMQERGRVMAEAGTGLVGDRYHGTRHRHVTIQSATALADAATRLGRPIDPAGTRRNLTITHGDVPTDPGTPVRVGDVDLEVVRVAAPCRLLDDELGDGAMRALHARAGSVCRLLGSGEIRVGDSVHLDA